MSGRHKMPPVGLRKAAADPGESTQRPIPEPEIVEETSAAQPAEAEVEETVDAGPEDVSESDDGGEGEAADEAVKATPSPARSGVGLPVVLAAVALVLALACVVLRWLTVSQAESDAARDESVQAAKEITAQMLSYETETVDQQLTAARDRMTGEFLGTYTAMIDEVIPEARARQIAAVAEVLRAGVVSAKPDSAELVLFVNQSVQVGNDMPKKAPSIARVTMVKVDDRWMMSEYEQVSQ